MEQKVKELALLGKSPQEIAKILGIPLTQMGQYHKALQEAFLLRAEFVPEPEEKAAAEEKPKPKGRKPLTPAQREKAKARKRKRNNEYQILRRQRMKRENPALYEEYLKKRRALQKAQRQKVKENNPEKYAEDLEKRRDYKKLYYQKNAERLKANSQKWYFKNKQPPPANDLEKWEDRLAREREWRLKYLAKHPGLKIDLDDPMLEEIRKKIELEQMQKKES